MLIALLVFAFVNTLSQFIIGLLVIRSHDHLDARIEHMSARLSSLRFDTDLHLQMMSSRLDNLLEELKKILYT